MGSRRDAASGDDFVSPTEADATRLAPSLAKAPPVPKGCLVYVAAGGEGDQGRWVRSDGEPLLLGRGPGCHLRLNDSNVSRLHVQITMASGGVDVRDLGSKNGIGYLGRTIQGARLPLGARIQVGGCSIDILPLEHDVTIAASQRNAYGDLVGVSLPMRRLFAMLEAIEQSEAPVLIQGETGTGKELVARAIHAHSARRDRPWLVIDCGNIPAELMESELFGHRRGAFTGAAQDHRGAFQAAHGGTVFLDEIGELSLPLQSKLLRVIESGEIKRLGDVHHSRVDVRFLAATNRHFEEEVAAGRFRQDLYYRLAVVQVNLPPLRERIEDIPLLVHHLLMEITGGAPPERLLAPDMEEALLRHDWPGNVRELRNTLQRMMALPGTAFSVDTDAVRIAPPKERCLSDAPNLLQDAPPTATFLPAVGDDMGIQESPGSPAPLPVKLPATADFARSEGATTDMTLHASLELPFRQAKNQLITTFEKHYLSRLWSDVGGNVSAAARRAGLDRKYIRALLRKHGLL